MDKIAKRKNVIVNTIYFLIIIGAFYAVVKYALGLILPVIIALFIAMMLQKPVNALSKKIGRGHGVISTVCVLLLFALVSFILWLIGLKAVDEVKSFWEFLRSQVNEIPSLVSSFRAWLLELIRFLPDRIEATVADYINQTVTLDASDLMGSETAQQSAISGLGGLAKLAVTPLSGAWSTVKQIPSIALSVVITIVTSCFLTADYGTLTAFIKRQMRPEKADQVAKTKKLILMSLKKIGLAYLAIIAITTTELCIGLGILKLAHIYTSGYLFLVSLCIAIIDIVPVLGTGTVLLPWAVISFCTHKVGMGIGLLVIYAVITVIRQVLEPKLVAGQFDLPAFVTIIAMYIGIKLFGPLGIFILPLTVIVLKLLSDEGIITFIHTEAGDKKAAETE